MRVLSFTDRAARPESKSPAPPRPDVLEVPYGEYMTWPTKAGVLSVLPFIFYGVLREAGANASPLTWLFAGAMTAFVLFVVWVGMRRSEGRIVITQTRLSAPTMPGSASTVAIPLASITRVERSRSRWRRGRYLLVHHADGPLLIAGRGLPSRAALNELQATLSAAVARARDGNPTA